GELAKSLQLAIEYDPEPPFDVGSPAKADASTLRLAMKVLFGDHPFQFFARVSGQALAARIGRARRVLSGRHGGGRASPTSTFRASDETPALSRDHPGQPPTRAGTGARG